MIVILTKGDLKPESRRKRKPTLDDFYGTLEEPDRGLAWVDKCLDTDEDTILYNDGKTTKLLYGAEDD